MRAMILAAGRGTRMGQLTDELPKPLIPISGKTLIEHQIERLRCAGIHELVINLAYRGAQIREHLGNGKSLGVSIDYAEEPEDAFETGGGIAAALDLLGDEPFAVANSDVWTNFDFSTLTAPVGAAHLVLVPNPSHNPKGDFCLSNGVIGDVGESLTFSGIGVYKPALFAGKHPPRFPLGPLLVDAARRREVSAERFTGCWIDVGTPARLDLVKDIVRRNK
jgi:MurNAc alpha-1-phosphate uridylyltransferase